MAYWWVNHKQTHSEEVKGGYIWSPKRNRNGAQNQTYENLTRTQVSDLIFSFAHGEIRALGVVEKPYRQGYRPSEFGNVGEQWDTDGWMVPVAWARLEVPLRPKMHIDTIAPLLPERNSPIQANGNGNQGCYLASISDELAARLLELIRAGNPSLESAVAEICDEIDDAEELARIGATPAPVTEKAQLVNARRGQGLFRWRVEQVEKACRLTGVSDRRFLVASHIKPWRVSNDTEKLDGHNGLLLSPHVDRLFDRGWISFSDDGIVLCADHQVVELMKCWGIDPSANVGRFSSQQTVYMAYHRSDVYRYGE